LKEKITPLSSTQPEKSSSTKSKLKTTFVILEIFLVLVLLILWFSSSSLRNSKNLWILFLYNFPSQFFIAVVPHEPVFLYFSKFYSTWTVTSVAIAGTFITELFNYSVLQYFSDFKLFKKLTANKFVKNLVNLFQKAPFIALIIAGVTPVPFYPFRFLVVISNYPLTKYALAVFLSRTFRFYLLAELGQALQIPDTYLILFFVLLVVIGVVPVLKNFYKSLKGALNKKNDKEVDSKNMDNGEK